MLVINLIQIAALLIGVWLVAYGLGAPIEVRAGALLVAFALGVNFNPY
jgi:hypothetical protein